MKEVWAYAREKCNMVSERAGINWTWFYFPTEEDAKRFVVYLNGENGRWEHRGIYPQFPDREIPEKEDKYWGVRWR